MQNGQDQSHNEQTGTVYLGEAILDLSKIMMYEFHYDYMKPKYGENLKFCYMNTDSLIYQIKTEDFYADIADDVPMRFDTSDYNLDRPLPIGLNKKVIGLMKDELGGAIMTEFVALRPKPYFIENSMVWKIKGAKGSRNTSLRKLSHLRIVRIASSTQQMSIDLS